MDRNTIVKMLELLGARNVRHLHDSVQLSCLFSKWNHKHGDNNPSMNIRVSDSDKSVYCCYSGDCAVKGTLFSLAYALNLQTGEFSWLMDWVENNEVGETDPESVLDGAFSRALSDQFTDVRTESVTWDEKEIERFKGSVPQYAVDRGLNLDTCRHFELGYDKLEKRLIIPVRREDGKLVGLIGRDITGVSLNRYKNYLGFEKSLYFFGEHLRDGGHPIVLFEGAIKAMIWHQYGVRNCMSIQGSSISEPQVRKLKSWDQTVILVFDNDKAGGSCTRKSWRELNDRILVLCVNLGDHKQPDELTRDEALSAIERAVPASGGIGI